MQCSAMPFLLIDFNNQSTKNSQNACAFKELFVFLHHRFSSRVVSVQLIPAGWRAVLFYEKDVFGRLSLWVVNFANSNHHSRQMATRRLRGAYLYTLYIIYSSFWRGLMRCLSCVMRAMRRPTTPGWAEEQTPTPFLYHKLTCNFLIINCLRGVGQQNDS